MTTKKVTIPRIRLYYSLTKPRIAFMVAVTLVIGFVLAGGTSLTVMAATLVGALAAAGGAGALNHCLERDADALMERTQKRPIPTGQISPRGALVFGIALAIGGVFWLQIAVNLKTSFLVLLTVFLYVLVYTPLKKLTPLNTFVGAIPGAIPPLVGWAAARDELGLGAYLLFLILFAWQHPHFYALAWIYKEDYARGGMKMLPVVDASGHRTMAHVLSYLLLLFIVSLLPVYFGMAGLIYLAGVIMIGAWYLLAGVRFAFARTAPSARGLFRVSLVYFPVMLALILVDGL